MSQRYFRQAERPQTQRGTNRDIALRLWAAVFIRGDRKCVWHDELLTALNHSIDHFDANRQNNRPENLLPSCVGCNSKRGETYESQEEADAAFDAYLREKGSTLAAAMRRAEKQRRTPIPQGVPRYSTLHKRAIASIWAPEDPQIDEIIREWLPGKVSGVDRLAQTRESGKMRSARSRAKQEREQREAAAFDGFDEPDDFDPFA